MISVYGGGFSGVTLAWELVKKGKAVTLYEKSHRLGGQIETVSESGLKHERAANAFLSTPEIRDLFNELELEYEEVLPTGKRKYIWRNGLKQWPLSFFETLQMVLRLLLSFLFRSLSPKREETVTHWGHRCLGPAATQYLLAPALTGIYAGELQKMSATLVIGSIFKKKSKSRGSIRPVGGMSEFFKKIEEKLKHKGCEIVLNSQVDFEDLSGRKIFCAGISEAQKVVGEKFECQAVAKVTLQFKEKPSEAPGFGVLIPEEFSTQVLGVVFDSYLFSESHYAETWILGGARWPAVAQNSESDLVKIILKERKKFFKLDEIPYQVLSTNWEKGIPDYNLKLESALLRGVFSKHLFHGNFLGAIGLSRIYERSIELSRKL